MDGLVANHTVRCYTTDWQRTRPDFVVYLPQISFGTDGYNDHFLVSCTPAGSLLAIWTQGSREAARDIRVVSSMSEDGGRSWSPVCVLADHDGIPGLVSCFAFPVTSDTGRIYCFYNKHLGVVEVGAYFAGSLRCLYSDDEGHSWASAQVDIPFRRRRYDHPDPQAPAECIVWQKPIRDSKGRWVVGFSRWSSAVLFPKPKDAYHLDSSAELLRFENINEGPHPRDLQITWLPAGEEPLRVPCPIEPEHSRGYSLCEEPAIVLLPDGRLFLVVRTVTGRIWYSVSDDDGASWRTPAILRYSDTGLEVLHPKSPCPLYGLEDGRFLLLFHNHDGFDYGANGPWDMNARRPLFVSIGEFQQYAAQPVWFGSPRLLFDTEGVGVGPESLIWLAMYSSLTEFRGQRVLWHPDRKHFLLGRIISDEWLGREN